jgi:hypothetical protein
MSAADQLFLQPLRLNTILVFIYAAVLLFFNCWLCLALAFSGLLVSWFKNYIRTLSMADPDIEH